MHCTIHSHSFDVWRLLILDWREIIEAPRVLALDWKNHSQVRGEDGELTATMVGSFKFVNKVQDRIREFFHNVKL